MCPERVQKHRVSGKSGENDVTVVKEKRVAVEILTHSVLRRVKFCAEFPSNAERSKNQNHATNRGNNLPSRRGWIWRAAAKISDAFRCCSKQHENRWLACRVARKDVDHAGIIHHEDSHRFAANGWHWAQTPVETQLSATIPIG